MRAAFLLAAIALAAPLPAHDLPLGDGRASNVPRAGYVMTCEAFRTGGPGAFRSGDWIANGRWDPARKPVVEGEVAWPNARISVAVEGAERVVRANNLPRHPTGEFPIRPGTRAFDYDRNPNHIGEQPILLRLPAAPRAAA